MLVSADDPQLFSSQNEQDNRHYARAAKVPLLEPSDSQEAKDLLVAAYEISERFDTPVILRTTTRIAHSKSPVTPGEKLEPRPTRVPERNPAKLVMMPANAIKRHLAVEERLRALRAYAEEFPGNRIEQGERSLGIIASGAAYRHAREVFPDASFLKLALSHPLPENLVREFASRVGRVVVVEELDPFLEGQVRALGIEVSGKDLLPSVGELTPGILAGALRGEHAVGAARQGLFPVPARPPILCPGCPHRGIFHLLGKRKYFVTGDIGCYTLAAIPPQAALHTCLCMGAGVGQALGIEKALGSERARVAAVIGDSTFFHSGMTPLVDIAHNGGRTTVIVLDNRTTAMTGRQDHPGTELTLGGAEARAVDIAAVARALGIDNVSVTGAFDLAAIGRALEAAESAAGPSVIVNRGPCVLLPSVVRGAPLKVDASTCTGCRLCLDIGCPALGWSAETLNSRGKAGAAAIDAALCNGCGICMQVCSRGAIIP